MKEKSRNSLPAIDLPCAIQPHGLLWVLEEPHLKIVQTSVNTVDFFDIPPEEMVGQSLDNFLSQTDLDNLQSIIAGDRIDLARFLPLNLNIAGNSSKFNALLHRNRDGLLILELEPSNEPNKIDFPSFYHTLQLAATRIQNAENLAAMYGAIAREVQKIANFDRVMVYKFDRDWSGEVVSEQKREDLESFLGLHYPHSDLGNSRPLYETHKLRAIVDIEAEAQELFPPYHSQSQSSLDLSNSVLRAIAPCHQEYLQNMGVRATLIISLIKEGKLWGLIACHHCTPKYLPYEFRQACEFLSQILSRELSVKEEFRDYDYKIQLQSIQARLTERMSAEEDFLQALLDRDPNLLHLTQATGVAIYWHGQIQAIGEVPETPDLLHLVTWFNQRETEEIFSTHALPNLYPEAEKYKDIASGLLAISIPPENYIFWFRPERIQTVHWAGDPHNAIVEKIDGEGKICLSPRHSFALWKEIVCLQSQPWKPCEIEAARGLRNAIVKIVLHQADELAKLARELERSNTELERFAYVASHDLQEPLNLVSSYVQLLEMRYRDRLDEDAKDFINFTVEGVSHMQELIDDLLTYSRVGTREKTFAPTDMEWVIDRVLTTLQGRISDTEAEITRDRFPTVFGDNLQLVQLWQNLLVNALKFRGDRPPKIHLGVEQRENDYLFFVRDNGIGLETQFADRIFLIFQRLHARDEYPGTGIGLAICKKIVERHGGTIWVESEPSVGATFYFTIPRPED